MKQNVPAKSREQYKRFLMLLGTMLIIAVQTALFAALWFNYYANEDLKDMRKYFRRFYFWRRGHWVIILLYALVFILFMKVLGGFRVGYLRNLDVFYSQILSVCATNAMEYLQLALIARWKFLQFSMPMLALSGIQIVLGILWIFAMRGVYARLYPPHEMLLIYGDISPKALIDKLRSRGDKYRVKATMNLRDGIEEILEQIPKYESIIIGDIPSHERNLFLKFCFEHDIRCYSVPKISDIMIISASEIDLFDSPLLLFRNQGLTFGQSFFKRTMDIVISLAGCILASPFMLVIAIAIKLYDGGPVFYTQERLTKGGRTFQIYKFRSMVVGSEKRGARLASAHDNRITPVGRVIRRLHFDELPQLFNVLMGDMSFVGPRPEREEITEEYERSIPQFRFRLKMKAGLTGYAQVYGQYNTVPYDKLKLDLTYIENYSLWLDIKLILLTVKILFQKEKSEGVQDSQKTALKKENKANTIKIEENAADSQTPLVSIIMPAYRAADYIGQAITSIQQQTCKASWELIIIDDHSPDDTAQVVQAYTADTRIRYLRQEQNQGVAAARNKGIREASGRYLAFLDPDDWWEKDKLQLQLECIARTKAVLCFTGRELMQPDGTPSGRAIPVPQQVTYEELLRTNVIPCGSVLIRADVAREFGFVHDEYHEDYILWLQVLKKYGPAVGVDVPALKCRLSAGGKSRNKWRSARMQYGSYRQIGIGRLQAFYYMVFYTVNGFRKYMG